MSVEFKKDRYKYLKNAHYQILGYMLFWIFDKKPPKATEFDGKEYYWFSLQKIADDNYKSYYQVKTALRRLAGRDKSVDYGNDEPLVYSEMVYSRKETNKAYFRLNYEKIAEILADNESNRKLFSKMKGRGVDMPVLFDVEETKKHYSEETENIVKDILNENSDIFKTRVGKTKTFERCCNIVQDIYTGNFTNPRIYDFRELSGNKRFCIDDWKEKVNSVKGDYFEVRGLLNRCIKNFRMMFDKKRMPEKKDCLPNQFDKWLYDEFNLNGYLSYFIFSLNEPNYTDVQRGENKADEIFKKLPGSIRNIGNEIVENYNISNDLILWENLASMYEWADNLFVDMTDMKLTYWVGSPKELIEKFLDYCDANKFNVNEYIFNVKKSFERNMPFKWFVSEAVRRHDLDDSILECA